jgi:hypothetical protein
MMDRLITCFFWILARIPILGSIFQTTIRDHREALRELFISLSISIAPLWGGAFALFVDNALDNVESTFLACCLKIIQNGELFIYSASILAPVMYIVTRERSDERSFPSKSTFMVLVIVFSIISAIIFTIARLKGKNLPDSMINISIIFSMVSLTVFYFALVYNNTYLPDPAQIMRDQEDDYLQRLRAHRH